MDDFVIQSFKKESGQANPGGNKKGVESMINKHLINALKTCELPVYFTTRGENTHSCLVFNVVESPGGFSDNCEDLTEYRVLLNIIVPGSRFVETTQQVKKLLEAAGYLKKVIPTAQWDESLEMFNQPLEYTIFLNSRRKNNGKSNWS